MQLLWVAVIRSVYTALVCCHGNLVAIVTCKSSVELNCLPIETVSLYRQTIFVTLAVIVLFVNVHGGCGLGGFWWCSRRREKGCVSIPIHSCFDFTHDPILELIIVIFPGEKYLHIHV